MHGRAYGTASRIPPGTVAAMPTSLPEGKDWSNANQDPGMDNSLGKFRGRCSACIVICAICNYASIRSRSYDGLR